MATMEKTIFFNLPRGDRWPTSGTRETTRVPASLLEKGRHRLIWLVSATLAIVLLVQACGR